jgi:hypothetical protein
MARTTLNKGGVNPALLAIVNGAVPSLPAGYTAQITPHGGVREYGSRPSLHHSGQAVDIQIYDANGKPVSNYQSPETFSLYQQFANAARAFQQQNYPQLSNQFNWGGYFSGNIGKDAKYGAMDLMHFSIGNEKGLAGSWDKGLSPEWAKKWGVSNSVGTSQQQSNPQQSQWGANNSPQSIVQNPFGQAAPATVPIGNVAPQSFANPTPIPNQSVQAMLGASRGVTQDQVNAAQQVLQSEQAPRTDLGFNMTLGSYGNEPAIGTESAQPSVGVPSYLDPGSPSYSDAGSVNAFSTYLSNEAKLNDFSVAPQGSYGQIGVPQYLNANAPGYSQGYGLSNFSVVPQGSFDQSSAPTYAASDPFSNYLSSQALSPQQDFSAVPAGSYDPNAATQQPLANVGGTDIANFGGDMSLGSNVPSSDTAFLGLPGTNVGQVADPNQTIEQWLADSSHQPSSMDAGLPVDTWSQTQPPASTNPVTQPASQQAPGGKGMTLSFRADPATNLPYQQPGGVGTQQNPAYYYANVPGSFNAPLTQGQAFQFSSNPSATTNWAGGVAGTAANSPMWNSPNYVGLGSVTLPDGSVVTRGTAMDAQGGGGGGTPVAGKRGIQGITAGPNAEDIAALDKFGNQKWTNPLSGPQNPSLLDSPSPFGPYGWSYDPYKLGAQSKVPQGMASYNANATIGFTPAGQGAQQAVPDYLAPHGAKGMVVPGVDHGRDEVPAWLEPGEVVFNLKQLRGLVVGQKSKLRADQIKAISKAKKAA